MKKIFVLPVLLLALNIYGQNVNSDTNTNLVNKKCKLAVSSIYLENTRMIISQSLGDLFDFDKFSFADNNIQTSKHDMGGSSSFMNVTQINLGAGFSPYCKKIGDYNRKMEIRFGFNFERGDWAAGTKSISVVSAGDNFISPSGVINSDTIDLTQIHNYYTMNVIGIDISFLARSNQEKTVSLFAGAGLNAGFSITSRYLTITKNTIDVIYSMDGYEINGNDFNYFNHAEQTDRNSSNSVKSVLVRLYVPFGVDFRLSKKHKVFNKFHLYLKGQLGADYQQLVDGSDNFFRPSVGMGMGLKYRF